MENKILVLMSTFNGEKHLKEQIESILKQENVQVDILVRDDGSSDTTTRILMEYEEKGKVKWYKGDNVGPARSFMDLLNQADDNYDYYAFCDQDDVWKSDKCSNSIRSLQKVEPDLPAMSYCSIRIVDEQLNPIHSTYKVPTENQVENKHLAIMTSARIPGCTMTFNRTLVKLVRQYKPKYLDMHDSWVQRVCSSCGGKLIWATDIGVLYRQHGSNVVGAVGGKKKELDSIFNKKNLRSNTIKELYQGYSSNMTNEMKQYVELVCSYRNSILNTIKLSMTVPDSLNIKMRIAFSLSILFRKY